MGNTDNEDLFIEHGNQPWLVRHDSSGFGGPASIEVEGREILRDCNLYIDDLNENNGILKRFSCNRKAGTALVTSKGYFPFGEEPSFKQQWKYGQNHVQITFDLQWPQGMRVKRRVGLGSCFLPGTWKRFYCIPPVEHLNKGVQADWISLPEACSEPVMVAHWHFPPLALVFENKDRDQLEIGTGGDLWRWENPFKAGPERGSYKVYLTVDGLQIVWEPLMCCLPYTPPPQNYRFKWYMAWNTETAETSEGRDAQKLSLDERGKCSMPESVEEGDSYVLDFEQLLSSQNTRNVPTQQDYIRGSYKRGLCWSSKPVLNAAKKAVRQISESLPPGTLILKGVSADACWNPAHLDKNCADGVPHWDINALLEFSHWTRRQLGDDWKILTMPPASNLPSVRGLFQDNGF